MRTISQVGTIRGRIQPIGTIHGRIQPTGVIKGSICKLVEQVDRQEKTITVTENGTIDILPDTNKVLEKVTVVTDVIGGDVEEYKGIYEVTPAITKQVLPTALKTLRNDVTIKEIPYYEVGNNSGGNTIIIAE